MIFYTKLSAFLQILKLTCWEFTKAWHFYKQISKEAIWYILWLKVKLFLILFSVTMLPWEFRIFLVSISYKLMGLIFDNYNNMVKFEHKHCNMPLYYKLKILHLWIWECFLLYSYIREIFHSYMEIKLYWFSFQVALICLQHIFNKFLRHVIAQLHIT